MKIGLYFKLDELLGSGQSVNQPCRPTQGQVSAACVPGSAFRTGRHMTFGALVQQP
jgi:hypothetical protein